jgi:DNA (cytosine-5)-methyltransferase 1
VFVVGYLGDWRVAAAVLFERESLQGNTKPSRKKREEVTANAEGSIGEAGRWVSPNGEETIGTIMARDYKGLGNQDLEDGRGLAIRPHAVAQPMAIAENTIGRQPMNGGNGDGFTEDGPMYTLNATGVHGVAQPIAFKVRGGCEGGGKGYLGQEEQAFTISATQDQQIAQPLYYESHPQDSRVNGPKDVADTVSATYETGGGNTPLIQEPIAVDTFNQTINERTSQTIGSSASDVNHYGAVLHSMAIRRLTPKECERLQGFPDDWTKIPYRNKEADQCPDGPRYKACGNSMAVPVMRWIGERINLIESIL